MGYQRTRYITQTRIATGRYIMRILYGRNGAAGYQARVYAIPMRHRGGKCKTMFFSDVVCRGRRKARQKAIRWVSTAKRLR